MSFEAMYRVGMLVILTILTVDSQQNFRRHVIKSFIQYHKNDEMNRKLDHLTLMIVKNTPDLIMDNEIIKKYERDNRQGTVGKIIGISHIRDCQAVFNQASVLKTGYFVHRTKIELNLNAFSKVLINCFFKKSKKIDETFIKKSDVIQEKIGESNEFSGITFICFNSALDMLRFKRYINPYIKKCFKYKKMLLRTL